MTPSAPADILEKAILDNPEEIANYAAYADLLLQQGNPQGELIQVQLALEDASRTKADREALKQREGQLLQNATEFVGPWASLVPADREPEGRGQVPFANPLPFRFHRGILHEITLPNLTVACARALVNERKTRLVQSLLLGGWAYEEVGTYDAMGEDFDDDDDGVFPSQTILRRWPYFANLRVFQLGRTSDETYGSRCDFRCHLRAPHIVELIKKMPQLRELYLFADSVNTADLFALSSLNHIRVLQIYHCWRYPLETLADNRAFSNLTHLLLHPKANGAWVDNEGESYITLAGVRAVLQSPHLQNLVHLRLRLTDMGDEGCEEIVRSGILKRLQVLDLRHGAISDAGARILASCPDLRRLKHLDIKKNQLTEAGIRALRGIVPSLEASFQHTPAEIAEGEYLFEGDYE